MDNLTKEMVERGIRTPFELTEFDQWANDATRRDINELVEKHEVFGLKLWSMEVVEKERLRDVCNFGVDVVFDEKDRNDVMSAIARYRNGELSDRCFIDLIFTLGLYTCLWV
jgi:hypothetical protein